MADRTEKSATKGRSTNEAVANPSATFERPMQVVESPALTEAEKKKALDTWEADERALQRASEEGMEGGTPPRLDEVEDARSHLPGDRAKPGAGEKL